MRTHRIILEIETHPEVSLDEVLEAMDTQQLHDELDEQLFGGLGGLAYTGCRHDPIELLRKIRIPDEALIDVSREEIKLCLEQFSEIQDDENITLEMAERLGEDNERI